MIPPPNHPLKRPKEGAAAPSLETPPNGAAAGLKVRRFDKYPGNLRKRHNLRHKRNLIRAFQRTRMRPGGFYPVVANNRPHPQTCPHGQVWTKRLFLPPCTAHSFSPRRKRMGGALPSHHHGCHFHAQIWTLFTLHCAPAATAAPNTASAGGHWPPWPEQRHHPPPGSKAPWPGSGPYTAPLAP